MENKNKILVLGNGFDLSFSYDTRYADFINFIEFVQGKQEPKSWTKNFFDRCLRKENEIKNNNYYDEFIELTKKNAFILYFEYLKKSINTWSDIEIEMSKIIATIKDVFIKDVESSLIEYDKNKSYIIMNDPYTIRILSLFGLIYNQRYTINNKENCYEINSLYFDYIYKIKWDRINQNMRIQLSELKKILVIYLSEYVPIIKDIHESDYAYDIFENKIRPLLHQRKKINLNTYYQIRG